MKNKLTKEDLDFCKRFNLTEKQFLGEEKIEGHLYLSNNQLTSLPEKFNPTVGGDLYLYNNQLTSLPEKFNPTVGGDLYLSNNQLTSLPEKFNPTVGGDLYLYNNQLTSLPEKFNPTVGGHLYLSNNQLTSLPEKFNPTVGGDLYLYNNQLTSLPEKFNPTVGGDLYLSSNQLTSLPEKFNPTVGGHLYLSSNQLTSLPEKFNPTVGGHLYLSNNQLTSLPEKFNPTVGGNLYLYNNQLTSNKKIETKKPIYPLFFSNGKYILADGILTEVLSKKGNAYKTKRIASDKILFLVTDGKGNFSHGETLRKATEDLRFKLIAETLKKEPIKADTVISIQYYRIITGACMAGCKAWMEQNGIKKEKMKASELLPLLEKSRAYGFEKFKSLITF